MSHVSAPSAEFNFAQHLIATNAQRGGKTALIDDVGRVSYSELTDQVRRFAGGLKALGLKREERVLLLMHDSSDWVVAFLGALYAGVVPVAVNTLLTADDYDALLIPGGRAPEYLRLNPAVLALVKAFDAAGKPNPFAAMARDGKIIDGAVADLTKITGQKPQVTRARKSIAQFKLREGQPMVESVHVGDEKERQEKAHAEAQEAKGKAAAAKKINSIAVTYDPGPEFVLDALEQLQAWLADVARQVQLHRDDQGAA